MKKIKRNSIVRKKEVQFISSSKSELFKAKSVISFSQYNMFFTCPKRYKLTYIDKIDVAEPSINLDFGTAMHNTLEKYVNELFKKSIKEADSLDVNQILSYELYSSYYKNSNNGSNNYSSKEEIIEFYEDGVRILDYFKKKKSAFISKRDYQLVGTEFNLNVPINKDKTIFITMYLDVVYYDRKNDELIIDDFKTSRMGWRKNKKSDKLTTDQVAIYKKYFSEKYNFPIDKIRVRFIILKRKLLENAEFPQKRITEFEPASGTVTMNRVNRNLNYFLNHVFDENGNRNKYADYPATSGLKFGSCKWCPFSKRYDICSIKERIKDEYLNVIKEEIK